MAAPKFNLYAFGNNGGRPAIFKDAKSLELKCNEYFNYCFQNKENVTITGLTLFLGFNSRDTLHQYKKKKEFSDIIKRACICVEQSYENELYSFKFGGAIFALKNINKEYWKDKTEQEVNQTISNVTATFGGAVIQSPSEPTVNP